MKKLNLLALAAAGMLFSACSDSTGTVAEESSNSWNGSGDGYISLSINLPTTPATRAANDNYDDGLADEYKVQDAGLLLFTGADEASATLMYAQPIILPFSEEEADVDNDNITTAYQTVAEVKGNVGTNLYGLVVLNYKNVMTINNGAVNVDGTTITTLEGLQSTVANALDGNKQFTNKGTNDVSNYFFMTNAVLQAADATAKAAAPTAAQIQTLVTLDKSKIYPTEAQAKANPAGTIYVERAVAKATLGATASVIKSGDGTDLNISKVEWAIDNIEPKSFIVRNPGDNAYIAYSSEAFTTPAYRFVGDVKLGTTPILHTEEANLYRHYWAIDPQYNDAATGLLPAAAYGATGLDKPQYCNENTFNVANQLYKNTTRAVIKVTTDGGTFFTVNSNEKRYTETAAKSYIIKDIVENPSYQNKIKSCLRDGASYTFSENSIDPTWTVDETTAQVKITKIDPGTDITIVNFDMTAIAELDFSDEIAAANDNYKVLKYTDGIVYYEARFEHFANTAFEKSTSPAPTVATAVANGDLAPWNFWETDPKPSAATAYPGTNAEQNYLGRYGMVRNNWYDVTITAFNKLGSPVDPRGNVENPDLTDDNIQEYISVKIAILSWAKRTQSWSF